MNEENVHSQFIVHLDGSRFIWVIGIVFAVLLADEFPIEAVAIAVLSLVYAAAQLRPVRLMSSESGASLGVLRRCRWEWWSHHDIALIQYAHWPRNFRGMASMRMRTVDGATVHLPGTTGGMLWRAPDLQLPLQLGSRRVRVLSTPKFLRLLRCTLNVPIETEGAEWLSPARPE